MNARLLEKKLKDFGVEGEVVEICPGPVVTMYEFAPGPGIKVSSIAGLSDDLSMALQALSIRIVAPIPGKGVVGVELPNREREMVSLEGDPRRRGIPAGQDEAPAGPRQGHLRQPAGDRSGPHAASAGRRRHRLRQIGLHQHHDPLPAVYLHSPRPPHHHGRPKMLELSIYEGIPHLLLPVVTNPKKAALALKRAVEEMGRRYRLMSDKGVRSMDSYNRLS